MVLKRKGLPLEYKFKKKKKSRKKKEKKYPLMNNYFNEPLVSELLTFTCINAGMKCWMV